jgi:hypothetical protein
MVTPPRACTARTESGSPCRQAPLTESDKCFWHHPDYAQDAAEARRLGGLRRKREGTARAATEFAGLDSVTGIRRLLEVAAVDTLALDTSVARSRTLCYIALAATKLLEVAELEQRVAQLEAVVQHQWLPAPSVFEGDAEDGEIVFEEVNSPAEQDREEAEA